MSQPDAAAPARVGIVGLGLLGGAIAARLVKAGFQVLGFDPDPVARGKLSKAGGAAAGDNAEVFSRCQRVFLSLPTSEIVGHVLGEVGGVLRSGQLILDTTTGRPKDVEVLARRLLAMGVAYVDACVSGSSAMASRGEAVILAGGTNEAVDRGRELLDAFASSVHHVGPSGQGIRMKLVTNLVLGLNRAVLAEGLLFARDLGIDPSRALDLLKAGAAYSSVMETKGPKMVAGDFAPEARLRQHLKDVRLILQQASEAGRRLPLSELHEHLLATGVRAGLADADNSAILQALDGLEGNNGG